MLKLIVCCDKNNGISKDGKIPWNIASEMNHFKQSTLNHTVVMGRKTFDSIGCVLKNRNNIIFSRNNNLKIENATICDDLDKIIKLAKKQDVFIIGGKEIYKLFEPYYDELIISELNNDYDCDTFLNINLKNFYLTKEVKNNEFTIKYYQSYKKKILYAAPVQTYWKNKLIKIKNELVNQYKQIPSLTIVQVGENFASNVYIKNKCNLAKELGINTNVIHLNKNISQKELIETIEQLNNDKSVHGILVQLPISEHLDKNELFLKLNPDKDVDAFNIKNIGKLWTTSNNDLIIACTPRGIIELLNYYNISLEAKNVVIIGRSEIVAKPLISLLLKNNATVQICHSKTKNLKQKTKQADIIICAIGKANFITKDYLKKNAIVIDVGINRLDNKIVGDVDIEDVIEKVKYISPVPGGVGLMTLIMLFYNLLICYKLNMCSNKN